MSSQGGTARGSCHPFASCCCCEKEVSLSSLFTLLPFSPPPLSHRPVTPELLEPAIVKPRGEKFIGSRVLESSVVLKVPTRANESLIMTMTRITPVATTLPTIPFFFLALRHVRTSGVTDDCRPLFGPQSHSSPVRGGRVCRSSIGRHTISDGGNLRIRGVNGVYRTFTSEPAHFPAKH